MRLNLNVINRELAKRGHTARLEKGDGYFYFHSGEAADWLDSTVRVRTINTLTLKEWMENFQRLRELNAQILGTIGPGGAREARKAPEPSGVDRPASAALKRGHGAARRHKPA